MPTIVVTGTRFGGSSLSPFGFDADFFDVGFGAFYIAYGSTTISTAAGAGTHAFQIPASGGRPRVTSSNLTAAQFGHVLQALDNSERDSGLSAVFQEMASKNITLNVRVTNTAPSWFENPQQAAGIRFQVVEVNNGPDRLVANTTVELVIIAGRIGNNISGNDFPHLLAHELTHLIRGSGGDFMLDEHQAESRDGQTFQNLFSVNSSSNLINSIDVIPQYHADGTWHHTGTNGNNMFKDDYGAWDYIVTGAGNDIIVSAAGSDTIVVNGGGVKIISDFSYGYDWLVLNTIQKVSDVVLTEIEYDLVLTSKYSAYAPVDDPNAVFLVDWYFFFGNDHVEFLKTANGEIAGLMTLAGTGAGGSYYGMAATEFATAEMDALSLQDAFRAPNRNVTTWDMPETTSPRYAGVTSYVSYSVSEELALMSQSEAEYLMSLDPALTLLPASSQYLAAIPDT